MADTPGRTRLSTRMSATPAPSVASKKPRAKPAKALPAVPTGKSHAYGAIGNVQLSTQLTDPFGNGGSFAARFQADRGAALNRDGGGETGTAPVIAASPIAKKTITKPSKPSTFAPPASSPSGPRIATPHYLQNNANDTTDNDDFDDDYDYTDDHADFEPIDNLNHSVGDAGSVTDLETQFSYTTSMPQSTASRRIAELQPPATREERHVARPWSVSIFLETLHRQWQDLKESWLKADALLKQIFLGLLAALVLLSLFDPGNILETGTNVCYKTGEYVSKPFIYIQQKMSGSEDLSKRIQALEVGVQDVRHHLQGIDPHAIKRLSSILPEQMLVRKNAKTGQLEFPTNFWLALQAKMDERDSQKTWDKFIEINEKKLHRHAQGIVQETLQNSHIVSREDLTTAVGQNYAEFRQKFSGQLRAFESSIHQSTALSAKKAVSDMIKDLPDNKGFTQLYGLTLANMARNTEIRLKTVNFFSHTYGATVHPGYTSPTHSRQTGGIWQWINRNIHDIDGRGYPSPARALLPWEEPADCWCAAASNDLGKAQIGVIMPRAMRPTSITIEHMPLTGTLDIEAAPRDFEVWVQSSTDANALGQSGGIDLGCGESPEHGMVCVGKATYNIHATNHIQNFDLEDVLGSATFSKFAVVRVLNNWGQDWTCIYRIRMHGDPEPAESDGKLLGEL